MRYHSKHVLDPPALRRPSYSPSEGNVRKLELFKRDGAGSERDRKERCEGSRFMFHEGNHTDYQISGPSRNSLISRRPMKVEEGSSTGEICDLRDPHNVPSSPTSERRSRS